MLGDLASNLLYSLITGIVASAVTVELLAHTTPLTRYLLRKAVSLLPIDERPRYREEWSGDLERMRAPFSAMFFVFGLFIAARRISSEVLEEASAANGNTNLTGKQLDDFAASEFGRDLNEAYTAYIREDRRPLDVLVQRYTLTHKELQAIRDGFEDMSRPSIRETLSHPAIARVFRRRIWEIKWPKFVRDRIY